MILCYCFKVDTILCTKKTHKTKNICDLYHLSVLSPSLPILYQIEKQKQWVFEKSTRLQKRLLIDRLYFN